MRLIEDNAPVSRFMILLSTGPGQPWTVAKERFHLLQDAEHQVERIMKNPAGNYMIAEVVESVSTFRAARTVVRVVL
jgi:hypothetical protein